MVKPDKLLHMRGWVSGYKLCYDFLNVAQQIVDLRQMQHLTSLRCILTEKSHILLY